MARESTQQVNYSAALILLGVTVMVCAQPQYEVQIDFPVVFQYRSGNINRLAGGTCCEPSETAPNCTTECSRIHVRLCFREEQHDRTDMDASNCPLGAITTPFTRTGLFTFTAIPGTTTTTTYPGSIQLLYRIEDEALSLIDCIRTDFIEGIVDRESGQFEARGIAGKNNIASLTIDNIRVICKENYTGSDCGNIVCEPQDDSTGHFNCTTDGNIVCLPGYQDPETNCVEAVTIMIPTTDITFSTMETTTIQTTPLSTTTSTPAPVGIDILPIAAGATVGGLVVILILIVIIIVAVLLVSRAKDKRTNERTEADTTQSISRLKNDESHKNNGGAAEAMSLYTMVHKEKKKPRDEPPPTIPYQGDIYTEVEKTGLFGEGEKTTAEAEYGTVAGKAGENGQPSYYNVPNNGTDSVMPNEYAEIGTNSTKTPQLVYADLSISTGKSKSSQGVYEDITMSEVEYSHIQ